MLGDSQLALAPVLVGSIVVPLAALVFVLRAMWRSSRRQDAEDAREAAAALPEE